MDFECYMAGKVLYFAYLGVFVAGLAIGLWWKEPKQPRRKR